MKKLYGCPRCGGEIEKHKKLEFKFSCTDCAYNFIIDPPVNLLSLYSPLENKERASRISNFNSLSKEWICPCCYRHYSEKPSKCFCNPPLSPLDSVSFYLINTDFKTLDALNKGDIQLYELKNKELIKGDYSSLKHYRKLYTLKPFENNCLALIKETCSGTTDTELQIYYEIFLLSKNSLD